MSNLCIEVFENSQKNFTLPSVRFRYATSLCDYVVPCVNKGANLVLSNLDMSDISCVMGRFPYQN